MCEGIEPPPPFSEERLSGPLHYRYA